MKGSRGLGRKKRNINIDQRKEIHIVLILMELL